MGLVPPASRGNLKEGVVINLTRFTTTAV